jgi:hypothetical protein
MEVPRKPSYIECSPGIHKYNIPGGTMFPLQDITDDPGILFWCSTSEILELCRCDTECVMVDSVPADQAVPELGDNGLTG